MGYKVVITISIYIYIYSSIAFIAGTGYGETELYVYYSIYLCLKNVSKKYIYISALNSVYIINPGYFTNNRHIYTMGPSLS